MDHRLSQLLQIASLAVLAWFGFKLLNRVHWVLVVAVVLVATSNTAIIWLLRYEPRYLVGIYRHRFVRSYIDWLCRWTGDQPPLGQSAEVGGELLLRSQRDFGVAAYRAQVIVRGHDDVIDELFSRIHQAVTLRKRRSAKASQPPLASFLLVGGEGIGKRYVARVLAKLLFRSSVAMVFDCRRATAEALFGTKGTPGELLEAVRKQPFQVIVLEHVESATPELVNMLVTIITEGGQRSPNSGRVISFQNTVFVMTTTKAAEAFGALQESSASHGVWHRALIEVLTSETLLDEALLNAFSAVLLCRPPTDLVQAEVIALLMKKEAKDYGVRLSGIEPEIIVSQVMQIDEATGFGLVPERVKKLLRKPLVAAAEQNHELLSLRVRW